MFFSFKLIKRFPQVVSLKVRNGTPQFASKIAEDRHDPTIGQFPTNPTKRPVTQFEPASLHPAFREDTKRRVLLILDVALPVTSGRARRSNAETRRPSVRCATPPSPSKNRSPSRCCWILKQSEVAENCSEKGTFVGAFVFLCPFR